MKLALASLLFFTFGIMVKPGLEANEQINFRTFTGCSIVLEMNIFRVQFCDLNWSECCKVKTKCLTFSAVKLETDTLNTYGIFNLSHRVSRSFLGTNFRI